MNVSPLLLLLTLVCMVNNVNGQKICTGISAYSKSSNNKHRFTTIQNGNYTIQALVTFTDGNKCEKVTKDGLVKTYAIKYALDKINSGTIKKYGSIGLQLDDVCRSLPVTMARGIEVVSLHRPDSVCRSDFLKCDTSGMINEFDVKQATAVIGTQMSFTTIPLASLMSLYYVPQVSYAASSRLLSKRELYKSFFRTIPSDTKQISVMLDIFKRFNWNYIFAVGSDDDYGKLGVSDLKRDALKRNVCISNDEYIPYQSVKTKDRVKEVVRKIKQEEKAKVVVLFCYVKDLGDLILEEAKSQGVQRVWLTSEAWNPLALTLSTTLQNQTEGLLAVSLKSHNMTFFKDYMRDQVENEWNCSMWFHQYMASNWNCSSKPVSYSSESKEFTCESGNKVALGEIMQHLSLLPGKIDNLIDSATSIGLAITKVLENECGDNTACYIEKLQTRKVTEQMYNTSFVNEQGRMVSFDTAGDPKSAFYTIENLQIMNGKHVFVPVGNWTQLDHGEGYLELDEEAIVWPYWWAKKSNKEQNHPFSRCSKECVPGEAVIGRTGCCWACTKCSGNNMSSVKMAESCTDCGNYSHTLDNTKCIKTPILWLEITDPAGMSITIISAIGMVAMIIASSILIKLRKLVTPNDPAPHLVTFSCILLILTFIYGPLHITEPTALLCQTRNSIFFMLLMMYAAILLIKSRFMTKYLTKHAEKSFRGNLLIAQIMFVLLLILLELVSVIAWLYIDDVLLDEFRQEGVYEIWKQCEVSFTAARLVSTFIPCIILIIATFCAFRERNNEHSFYEPKFLSFTCIALCIIIVAFLPTFKYVVGIYKAIVMAFTMDVFAYTFMACLVLPKAYVAIMRHKRGVGEYPMKPGSASKKTEKEKVKDMRSQPSLGTSHGEKTESSMCESTISVSRQHPNSVSNGKTNASQLGDVTLHEKDEEGVEEKEVIGYSNAVYEEGLGDDGPVYSVPDDPPVLPQAPLENTEM